MSWLRAAAAFALYSSAAFAQSPSAEPGSTGAVFAPSEPPPSPTYSTVVTATRDETPANSVSSTVSVITAKQLRDWQSPSVADALRSVPGLDVVRTGGPGGLTRVYTRGTNPNHTLVLVDGVPVADPSDPDGTVDLADLSTEGIDRIEVLRGPASSLYGSDALGGVVNILTLRGRGAPTLALSAEGGSFGTYRVSGRASGSSGETSFSAVASHLATDGIPQLANGSLPDAYQRTLASLRLGQRFSQSLEGRLVARYTRSQTQLLDFGADGALHEDPNYTQKGEELLLRPEVRLSLFGGRWRQTLGANYSHHGRNYDNEPDLQSTHSLVGRYQGRKARVDWQHELALSGNNRAMVVLESEWDRAKSYYFDSGFGAPAVSDWTRARTMAVAVQDRQQILGWLSLNGSARIDDHSMFGTIGTYSVGAAATLPRIDSVVRLNLGTGFKAPSLLQLKDPQYGNPDLRPERNRSFEAGLEQPLKAAGLTVGGSFFVNSISQLISLDPTSFRSINVAAARIVGLESFVEGTWRLGSLGDLRARADYTWMQPKDRTTGDDLLRRARNKANLAATWSPIERASFTARVSAVGERRDNDYSAYPPAMATLKPYVLVSLMARYDLGRTFGLFARIENLLNTRYQEVLGYGTPGLSAFGGVRVEL